ncbi:hypothetical protein [Streptomyces sp. NPDC013489]|uniref:hypothetical protein n=1 Tax=Streptomyces sp. NPDC013489 TaxID=3155606 RepID=UPI0033F33812
MSGTWVGMARLFEDISYDTLYELEFGEKGFEDGPDEYYRVILPVLARWRKQLQKKRADLGKMPAENRYRSMHERWLREETEAYQRALLKASAAWLTYFFASKGSGIPTSLMFELDGGES